MKGYTEFEHLMDKYVEEVDEYNSANDIPVQDYEDMLYRVYDSLSSTLGVTLDGLFYRTITTANSSNQDFAKCLSTFVLQNEDKERGSILQQYFDDVRRVYNQNNNEFDIEYCEENRDKLISMNLKSIVAVAKSFSSKLNMPLEDLISAGNLGLCIAWDKFDPNRSKLQTNMLDELGKQDKEQFTAEEVCQLFDSILMYGKARQKFDAYFTSPENISRTFTKAELAEWIKVNTRNARFNSVAVQWATAYIMIEYYDNSRLIKKPKTEIRKERDGESVKEVFMDINGPVSDRGQNTLGDVLYIPDHQYSEDEIQEGRVIFKDGLAKLLKGVKVRDRRILMQRFGIGFPRALEPKEIAAQEGLSVARVSQIIQNTIGKMKANQEFYKLDEEILFDAVQKIY